MERVNYIINHRDYQVYLNKIMNHERNRIFCKHDKKHFLDVARIAYIYYLEEKLDMKDNFDKKESIKEIFYAAGLLHDIGRWREYEEGVEHHKASGELAVPILEDCGFHHEEIQEILTMILSHRNTPAKNDKSLAAIFYRADKSSRECFWCPSQKECNWKNEKKNLLISG